MRWGTRRVSAQLRRRLGGEISFELILLAGLVALGTVLGLQTLASDTGEGALTSACRLLQKVGLGAGGCGAGGDDDGAHADPDPRLDTDLALNREAHNAEEDIVVVPQPDDSAAPRPPQMTSRHGLDEIIAAEQDARFRERFGVDLDLSEADLATLVGADPAAFRTTQTVAGIQLTEAMIPAEVRPGAPTVRPGTRVVRPLGFPANINRPPTMAPSALLRALRLTPMTALTLLHGSSGPFSRRLEHPDFEDVWFRLSESDGGYRLSAHQCRESGILRCTLPKRLGEVELYPLQDVLPPADFEVLGLPEGAFIDPNSLQVVDLTHARSMTEWDFHFHPETLFEGFTEPRASREGERVYVFVDPNRYEVHFDPDTWTVVIRDKETGAEVPESEVTGGWLAPDGSVWSSREGGVRLDGGPGADVVVADGAATMSAGPSGSGAAPERHGDGEEDDERNEGAIPPVPTLQGETPGERLTEALNHLVDDLPRNAYERARRFNELLPQIGGNRSWEAREYSTEDGDTVFMGDIGVAIIIDSQGLVLRGSIESGTVFYDHGAGEVILDRRNLAPHRSPRAATSGAPAIPTAGWFPEGFDPALVVETLWGEPVTVSLEAEIPFNDASIERIARNYRPEHVPEEEWAAMDPQDWRAYFPDRVQSHFDDRFNDFVRRDGAPAWMSTRLQAEYQNQIEIAHETFATTLADLYAHEQSIREAFGDDAVLEFNIGVRVPEGQHETYFNRLTLLGAFLADAAFFEAWTAYGEALGRDGAGEAPDPTWVQPWNRQDVLAAQAHISNPELRRPGDYKWRALSVGFDSPQHIRYGDPNLLVFEVRTGSLAMVALTMRHLQVFDPEVPSSLTWPGRPDRQIPRDPNFIAQVAEADWLSHPAFRNANVSERQQMWQAATWFLEQTEDPRYRSDPAFRHRAYAEWAVRQGGFQWGDWEPAPPTTSPEGETGGGSLE